MMNKNLSMAAITSSICWQELPVMRGFEAYSSHVPRCSTGVLDRFNSALENLTSKLTSSFQAATKDFCIGAFMIRSKCLTRYGGWRGHSDRIIGGVGMKKRLSTATLGRSHCNAGQIMGNNPWKNFFHFLCNLS